MAGAASDGGAGGDAGGWVCAKAGAAANNIAMTPAARQRAANLKLAAGILISEIEGCINEPKRVYAKVIDETKKGIR